MPREKFIPAALNTRDAAHYLGLSPNTLKAWRSAGRGPEWAVTETGVCLYARAALDAWLEGLAKNARGRGGGADLRKARKPTPPSSAPTAG